MILKLRRSWSGLALGAGLVALCALGTGSAHANSQLPQTPLPGKSIPKFVDPLPVFGPASGGAAPRVDGTKPLTVTMKEFQQKVLPASFYTGLPVPLPGDPDFRLGTVVWGYEINDGTSTFGPLYPAFTIEARRNTPTTVKYVNDLVGPGGTQPFLQKLLTVDQSIHWANPLLQMTFAPFAGPVPAVVHLHGAEDPSAFDGGPDSWFTPGAFPCQPPSANPTPGQAICGPGFVTDTYTYPNQQEPTTLFFHDHTLGATRLNLYSGLVGFYLIRNDPGNPLEPVNLPNGPYEIEMAIQDKMFDTNGQLFFPDEGINPTIHPFWIPEFFGDAIVVNGKTWPFLNVEPRRYRFRLVNGSNARFFTLSLQTWKGGPAPDIWQIGSDGGLLNAPVKLGQLTIAPGERAGIIVDFGGLKQGAQFLVRNSARAPFPSGETADPQTVAQIMQINVALPLQGADNSFDPAAAGANLRPTTPIVPLASAITLNTPVRRLTLNEIEAEGGPREVLLNNSPWEASYTENPRVGNTEVWEIINTTEDTHPIHIHLVQFQLLNRQKFKGTQYDETYEAAFPGGTSPIDGLTYPAGDFIPGFGPPLAYGNCNAGLPNTVCGGNPDVTPFLVGHPTPPDSNEAGWKDTFRMNPGEVTRVVVRWAQQDKPTTGTPCQVGLGPQPAPYCVPVPGANTYPFDPTAGLGVLADAFGFPGGPGYVWHCHIVDHEDNEMMRPYQVEP